MRLQAAWLTIAAAGALWFTPNAWHGWLAATAIALYATMAGPLEARSRLGGWTMLLATLSIVAVAAHFRGLPF